MFIYNLKLNTKNTAKIVFVILTVLALILLGIAIYKMIKENFKVHDIVDHPDVAYITSDNYTNILREVYDDIDTHLRTKNLFYRLYI